MSRSLKPEEECPECKGPISWKIVRNTWGSPFANGLCSNCNIVFQGREAPEITHGMELEESGKIDGTPVKKIKVMDKRITRLSCDVQIGILRERQHPNDEVYSCNKGVIK